MVKVNAPMLSLAASGKLGGAIVFSTWKGRPYVRSLVKPANPKSGGQTGLRSYFKFLTQDWTNIDAATQALWEDKADQLVASPFNAYIKDNMLMARNFLPPSWDPVRDPTQTPSAIDIFTATPGERQITITINDDGLDDTNWGFALFMGLSTAFTPAFDNMVALIKADGTNEVTFVHTPLVPDTYYYDAKPFSDLGNYGALDGEINGVVT